MWATYNYDNLPTVLVTLNGVIKSDDEFRVFITEWLTLFNLGDDFIFVFDTINCGLINVKYAIQMAYWIKRFKKRGYKNLKWSEIIVANRSIIYLLRLIFFIERPIAPVKIVFEKSNGLIVEETFRP